VQISAVPGQDNDFRHFGDMISRFAGVRKPLLRELRDCAPRGYQSKAGGT